MWARICALTAIISAVLAEKDFYETLGAKPTDSIKDIQKAYWNKQKEFQHEIGQGKMPGPGQIQRLMDAFKTLSDDTKRAAYDREYFMDKSTKFQAKKEIRKSVAEENDRTNYMSRKQLDSLEEKDLDDFQKEFSEAKTVQSGAYSYSSFSQTNGDEPIISSHSEGFHSDGKCQTVTERNGDSVSTRTTCTE